MRFQSLQILLDGTHLLSPLFNGLLITATWRQLEFYQLVSHFVA